MARGDGYRHTDIRSFYHVITQGQCFTFGRREVKVEEGVVLVNGHLHALAEHLEVALASTPCPLR